MITSSTTSQSRGSNGFVTHIATQRPVTVLHARGVDKSNLGWQRRFTHAVLNMMHTDTIPRGLWFTGHRCDMGAQQAVEQRRFADVGKCNDGAKTGPDRVGSIP